MLRFSMGNAILNKLMNLLISLARDIVVPPLGTYVGHEKVMESTHVGLAQARPNNI